MAASVSIPTPSGCGTIRIRDRRRTRRAPHGAIVLESGPAWRQARTTPVRASANDTLAPASGGLTRDDARQFAMSFTAFFTASMIFLA